MLVISFAMARMSRKCQMHLGALIRITRRAILDLRRSESTLPVARKAKLALKTALNVHKGERDSLITSRVLNAALNQFLMNLNDDLKNLMNSGGGGRAKVWRPKDEPQALADIMPLSLIHI